MCISKRNFDKVIKTYLASRASQYFLTASDTMRSPINGISLLFSMASVAFLIAGCINYNQDKDVLESTPWIHATAQVSVQSNLPFTPDNLFPADFYFGLRGVYATADNSVFSFDTTLKYKGSDCDSYFEKKYCDICQRYGRTSFSLNIVAAIGALVVVCSSIAAIVAYNKSVQITNVTAAAVAAFMSLISIVGWRASCWRVVDGAQYQPDARFDILDTARLDPEWGRGAILTMVATALMWLVFLMQLVLMWRTKSDPGYHNASASEPTMPPTAQMAHQNAAAPTTQPANMV
jgi:hypothetical protein